MTRMTTTTSSETKESVSCSVMPDSLRPHELQPTKLLCPWDFPGKDTGVGCHFLIQGIFPTQRSNPGLLHCRQILYRLSYKGSPIFAAPHMWDLVPKPGIEPETPALEGHNLNHWTTRDIPDTKEAIPKSSLSVHCSGKNGKLPLGEKGNSKANFPWRKLTGQFWMAR